MGPIYIPSGDPNEQRAKDIAAMEAHLRHVCHLSSAACVFLMAAYPHADPVLAARLADAWEVFQLGGLRERIDEMKAAPAIRPGQFFGEATPEILVSLQSQRERINQQIQTMETGLEKLAELAPGLDSMFRGFVMPMLEGQRDDLDSRIEQVQEQLDKQAQDKHVLKGEEPKS